MVIDNVVSLILELKDDSKKTSEEKEEDIGLTTYSNSNSTVLTYVLILEKCDAAVLQRSMTKNNDAAIAASAAPTTLSPTARQQEQPLKPSLAPQQPQSQHQEAVNNI